MYTVTSHTAIMTSYFFSAVLFMGFCLMTETAPPKFKLPTLEELRAKIEERREIFKSRFTTEAPPQIVPLAPPTLDLTTPNPFQPEREKLYINPPEPITPMYQTRGMTSQNSDSSFDHDDFQTLTSWLQDVPPGRRLSYLTRNVLRRAMHSFINNDEHTLKGISPGFDRAHHYINTIGRIILPHPDRLQITEPVPSVIPEHISLTRLREKIQNKLGIKNYLQDENLEEEEEGEVGMEEDIIEDENELLE